MEEADLAEPLGLSGNPQPPRRVEVARRDTQCLG